MNLIGVTPGKSARTHLAERFKHPSSPVECKCTIIDLNVSGFRECRDGRSRCRLPVEDASSDIKHQRFNLPLYHLSDALLRFNLGQLSYQRSTMSLAHR